MFHIPIPWCLKRKTGDAENPNLYAKNIYHDSIQEVKRILFHRVLPFSQYLDRKFILNRIIPFHAKCETPHDQFPAPPNWIYLGGACRREAKSEEDDPGRCGGSGERASLPLPPPMSPRVAQGTVASLGTRVPLLGGDICSF